jgi:hypothetical protein
MARHCKFSKSPVTFLRIITGLRRKGQSFNTSHMGRVLNGELLKEDHFIIQSSRPTALARITDGNEMFKVNEVIDVMNIEDEAPGVKKVSEEVEMIDGHGWTTDENGAIFLDD